MVGLILGAFDVGECSPPGPDLLPKLITQHHHQHHWGGGLLACGGRAPSAGQQPLFPGNRPKGGLGLDDLMSGRSIWRDPYLAMSVSRTPSRFTITNSEPSHHPGALGGGVGR